MTHEATSRRGVERRLAAVVTLGLALWLWSGYILTLPGTYDSGGGGHFGWALFGEWALRNSGGAIALISGYRLARRVQAQLVESAPAAASGIGSAPRRRVSAVRPMAVGLALLAAAELPGVLAGPGEGTSPLVLFGTQVAFYAAALLITVGVYLALRRLVVALGAA